MQLCAAARVRHGSLTSSFSLSLYRSQTAMAMIARTMLRSSPAAYMGVRAMSTEIPINSVARVVRCAAAHSRHPPRRPRHVCSQSRADGCNLAGRMSLTRRRR
jgi:hypothetical protein